LVIERGVCEASATTIARWLAEDAIKPWQHRSWIFPRDPRFLEKAGPVLDLYQRRWQGELLHPGDLVICADEKTQIQARRRDSPTTAPAPGRPQRVEHFLYIPSGRVTGLDEDHCLVISDLLEVESVCLRLPVFAGRQRSAGEHLADLTPQGRPVRPRASR
jgi:hypothetical protein